MRLPHDFVTERLCGRAATDRGDASGTGWWSTRDEAYCDEVLGLTCRARPRRCCPRCWAPPTLAGEVGAAPPRQLGLPEGVLVGPGTGDNMGAALGLGRGCRASRW